MNPAYGSCPTLILQGGFQPGQQPWDHAALQKALPIPSLPLPPPKHSQLLPGSHRACNEKQVSHRDLSSTAVWQFGVTVQDRKGQVEALTSHPAWLAPKVCISRAWQHLPPHPNQPWFCLWSCTDQDLVRVGSAPHPKVPNSFPALGCESTPVHALTT